MQPLRIAVVGHTNTGKTSLLRTLARDPEFGEVSDRPATTRDVAAVALTVDGEILVELFDTPGLEDSIALLEAMESATSGERIDGPAQLERLAADGDVRARFSQELKALRQATEADLVFYVIDARDSVLPRHRDELTVLSRCGRPLIPILNFVAGNGAQPEAWRQQLGRLGLHAVAEFDTVVFSAADEAKLFEKSMALAERHRNALERLVRGRGNLRRTLIRSSSLSIADLLLDAGAMVEEVDRADQREALDEAAARLQKRLRAREDRCVRELLNLFGFDPHDATGDGLPLVDGRWGLDLFGSAAIRRYGPRVGAGAAAGAAAGAGIDLVVGGITLGAAAAIGALVGSVLTVIGPEHRRLVRRARGGSELRTGPATMRILASRQIELVMALLQRGHASRAPVKLADHSASESSSRRINVKTIDDILQLVETTRPSVDRGSSPLSSATTPRSRDELAGLIRRLISELEPPESRS